MFQPHSMLLFAYLGFLGYFELPSAALIAGLIWPADGERHMLAVISLEALVHVPAQPDANSLGLVGLVCSALCCLNAAQLNMSCISAGAPQPQLSPAAVLLELFS